MSFSVAACDLTAMEAMGWLDKSSAATACVSIAASGYCARCLPDSASFSTQCRRGSAATSPAPTKRQRLASPNRLSTILLSPRSPTHSPVQPPRPRAHVERLTCALLTAIAPFLTMREKLLHLTHLSHFFPALTPTCFRRDDFNMSRAFIAALSASKSRQHLFSQLQSLTYIYQPPQLPGAEQADAEEDAMEREKAEGVELSMPFAASSRALQQFVELLTPSLPPAAALPVFPALSSLILVLGPQLTQSLCNSLFACFPSLSHLAQLHFGTQDKDKGERVTSVALSDCATATHSATSHSTTSTSTTPHSSHYAHCHSHSSTSAAPSSCAHCRRTSHRPPRPRVCWTAWRRVWQRVVHRSVAESKGGGGR